MMTFKHLLKTSLLIMVVPAALQSCHKPAQPGIYQNDQIESTQRSDLHALNTILLQELKGGKADALSDIMSKEMIDDHSKYRQVELVSNRLKEGDYSVLDEFYIVSAKKDTALHAIKVTSKGINNYEYNYFINTQEQYIVFFVPKNIPNQYMITAEFCKFDYGWKLTKLDLGEYTVNGKTGPELNKLAHDRYNEHCLAVATTIAQQAGQCLRPGDSWKYPNTPAIGDFTGALINETNKKYEFPYTVTQVRTQPWIFRVFSKTTPQGTFPQIYYISHIKLADTNSIKKENANIQKVITKILPGVDKDNKYIYYSAFKNMPDGSGSFDHFDMIEKLK
ncbi:MAG: hypothetical protein ACHQHN_01410 [Sphingobacteriales bacterium]